MVYRVIGLMSGSSLDGLDIAFVEFDETGGKWQYQIKYSECVSYNEDWLLKLKQATTLSALDYQLLHTAYGRYLGDQVNAFIDKYELHHQVQLIASHGHTTFHLPHAGLTAQLGDGATIAAVTEINVVSDLRALDIAFGGQGAPIVPVGEKLLFSKYDYFLNLGGIANISLNDAKYIAFDVCAANRVLNMLSNLNGKEYDEGGTMASTGDIDTALLTQLNALDYYKKPFPKSLANSFGIETVFPLIKSSGVSTSSALRTYTEHVVMQITYAIQQLKQGYDEKKMLVTGGGAFNHFLIQRLKASLQTLQVEVVVPDDTLIQYKEALIMAQLGVLRWREENTVMHSVTGASRSSIGGAVWIGQEA